MKLSTYLDRYFHLDRAEYRALPNDVREMLCQWHRDYNQECQKLKLKEFVNPNYKPPMSQEDLLELCDRPLPELNKKEEKELETKYDELIDEITSNFIDNVTEKIKNTDSNSLSLDAQIYVSNPNIPYWYDENYKYLDLEDYHDLKQFVNDELDGYLMECYANEIGQMGFDVITSWPFYLNTPQYGPINPEFLFSPETYSDNLSNVYTDYLIDQVLSPKYFGIPLTWYFYNELDGLTCRKLKTPENFINQMKQWLKDHHTNSLNRSDAPYDLAENTYDWLCDSDNYYKYEDKLYNVVTNKIAKLWNTRYYPRAQKLLESQEE